MAHRVANGEEHGSPAIKNIARAKRQSSPRVKNCLKSLIAKKGTTPSEQTSSTRCDGNFSPATLQNGMNVVLAAWTCPPTDFAKMPYLRKNAIEKFASHFPLFDSTLLNAA